MRAEAGAAAIHAHLDRDGSNGLNTQEVPVGVVQRGALKWKNATLQRLA
jgi:hypothetical protein